ncbi:hypothetical protein [Streptomyces sp. NPDC002054]|uniref:hypothetical protein n=1 Tax=Streptomyces sp. NPDC002054 TaxID=3154663 RepID=UPI00331C305E
MAEPITRSDRWGNMNHTMRGLAFIALTATAALLTVPSTHAVDRKSGGASVSDTCGDTLLTDYLVTAEGTADTAFAGTLTVAGGASPIAITVTPQASGGAIPNGLVSTEFSHPAISDGAVTSAPSLVEDPSGRSRIRFETPWGPTLATAECTGATTRVTELTGGITFRGVAYQYVLTRA